MLNKNLKIAVMQPYLFPYVGYWQLVNVVDIFVVYDDVNFIKKGYINRNNILINGVAKNITLSLSKASQNKLINEINIGDNRKRFLNTIKMSYGKAPFYLEIYPLIEDILIQSEKNLAKFVGYSIEKLVDYLDINTKIIYSSDIDKNNNLKGQNKIIAIVKTLGGTNYINAIGGQKLYDRDRFYKENIQLNFIKTNIVEYKQFKNKFVPYLSIIDILMFNSKEQVISMLNNYELI